MSLRGGVQNPSCKVYKQTRGYSTIFRKPRKVFKVVLKVVGLVMDP